VLQFGYSKDQQMGVNTLQEIYFVPVPAQAGFLSHVSDKVYKNNLVRIQLPPDYTGINYIFEVDGDSMYPTFTNGDHVGCRHLESKKYFRYGEPYLLDIGDGGILLKRIFRHENPSLVILRSDNILYQDIEVERQDILHAFLVTTRLSKNVGRSSLDLKN
jgi:phage repressor protein C with HTH and peptisase S24 domain